MDQTLGTEHGVKHEAIWWRPGKAIPPAFVSVVPDVVQMSGVQPPLNCRYAALSYSCGQTNTTISVVELSTLDTTF